MLHIMYACIHYWNVSQNEPMGSAGGWDGGFGMRDARFEMRVRRRRGGGAIYLEGERPREPRKRDGCGCVRCGMRDAGCGMREIFNLKRAVEGRKKYTYSTIFVQLWNIGSTKAGEFRL